MQFDLETKGYVSKCRASLDKSGRAGVQDITMFQPVVDMHGDVGSALVPLMQQKNMDRAMILFVLSDWRLPFGQMRVRNAYDESDPRIKSAYMALGPDHRVSFLNIGVGHHAADEPFSAQEAASLPRILANAATAIELWISEMDLGLVMRFVNRPALYELSSGRPSRAAISDASTVDQGTATAAASETESEAAMEPVRAHAVESSGTGLLMSPSADDDNPSFVLFDCSRQESFKVPKVNSAPLPTQLALAALQERPGCEALKVGSRNFASLAKLEEDAIEMVLDHEPGMHLRLQDDEDLVKALLTFHPDGDRLLEDLVAVKVDCSPVDDHTKCLWVIKFDGYEEDVSLQTCFARLREYVKAQGMDPQRRLGQSPRQHRLGPGRWGRAIRESTFDRSKVQELHVKTRGQT